MTAPHDHYKHFAEFYDEGYQEDFYLRYFKFIADATGIRPSEQISVLDVACGTGRLLSHFKDHGCAVRGVDSSTAMAAQAKQRAIPVTVADMRSFDLGECFDLVLCTFDSINYLSGTEDLSRALRSVAHHVRQGGWFVFDMITPYKIDVRIPTFGTTYQRLDGRDVIWLNDHKPGTWINTLITFVKDDTGYQRFEECHCSHAFSLEDVSNVLRKSGFSHHSVYGSDAMEPVNEQSGRWYFACSS